MLKALGKVRTKHLPASCVSGHMPHFESQQLGFSLGFPGREAGRRRLHQRGPQWPLMSLLHSTHEESTSQRSDRLCLVIVEFSVQGHTHVQLAGSLILKDTIWSALYFQGHKVRLEQRPLPRTPRTLQVWLACLSVCLQVNALGEMPALLWGRKN